MRFCAPARPQTIAVVVSLAIVAACIGLVRDPYVLLIFTLAAVWGVMGLAWTVLGGYAGLVSFGHAAFFGLGAYTVALLVRAGVSAWIAWPLAGLIGAAAGLLIGRITFRLQGHYFSLAMLAYPLALLYLFDWAGWNEVALPMQRENPWLHMQFADPRVPALLALGMLGGALALCLWIERSRFGLALTAIRQNQVAAEVAGLPTLRWKLRAIAVSGALAGLAGGFYATVLLIVTPPSVFGMLVSAQALIVSMFGGIGTAWGPVVGALILVPLSEWLHGVLGSRLPGIQGLVFGAAIMTVILIQPQGVMTWLMRRRAGMGSASEANVATMQDQPDRATPGPALLQVAGVDVRFGGVQALTAVTLEVRQGEILGIIGPNGAGKTTLFNVLNGLSAPAAGTLHFDGHPLLGLMPHRICALGIGRTFQTVRAFPRSTVLENVVVGAFAGEQDDAAALDAARAALVKVGMLQRADARASELTSRELRLMELARALAGRPRLLLLDESFAGLSTSDIEAMIMVLRRLCADGLTIAIIEHTMQAMVRLADRFVVLDGGRVIAEGVPADVVRDPAVITAYLGRRWAEYAAA